jgi:hypothetical protein
MTVCEPVASPGRCRRHAGRSGFVVAAWISLALLLIASQQSPDSVDLVPEADGSAPWDEGSTDPPGQNGSGARASKSKSSGAASATTVSAHSIGAAVQTMNQTLSIKKSSTCCVVARRPAGLSCEPICPMRLSWTPPATNSSKPQAKADEARMVNIYSEMESDFKKGGLDPDSVRETAKVCVAGCTCM